MWRLFIFILAAASFRRQLIGFLFAASLSTRQEKRIMTVYSFQKITFWPA